MRIISRRALREFCKIRPVAESPHVASFRIVKLEKFADFNAIKRAFDAADYVAPFTIFDIGGSKFRVVTAIHYNRQRLYIRHVFTHLQYDEWTYEIRKRKRKRKKRTKP